MRRVIGWAGRYVLPLLLLVGAFYASRLLIAARPEAVRQVAQKRVVPVEVVAPIQTNHVVHMLAMGQVVPARHVEVRAQVGGRIASVHPDFEVGGRLAADATLATIEEGDYVAALAEAESAYAQASLAEKLELQRQGIAQEELQSEGIELPDGPGRAIALREPQVEAARRGLAAAAAAVERARRNLDRTQIFSSFDAIVLRKTADIGSVLSSQSLIGEIADIRVFHVEVVLAPAMLAWLPVSDGNGHFPGAPAVQIGVSKGESTVWREGRLVRLLGDMRGNMARVLVAVDDPLADGAFPILLGSFVQVDIPGQTIEDVWRIPRTALRDGNRVFLANDEERLDEVQIEVVWQNDDFVFVRGLSSGQRIITTALAAAVQNMPVSLAGRGKKNQTEAP